MGTSNKNMKNKLKSSQVSLNESDIADDNEEEDD